MFRLLVKRVQEYKDVSWNGKKEDSTISNVSLIAPDGTEIWKCYCVENAGPSTDESGKDKRIVARDYQLKWRSSSKNGPLVKAHPEWKASDGRNQAIHVVCKELPGFADRAILIHTGNSSVDSLGCLLFGMNTNNGVVGNSTEAIHQFYTKIKEIGIENVILTVEEIS